MATRDLLTTRDAPALSLRAAFSPGSVDAEKRTAEVVWTTGARVLHDGNAVLVLIDFPDAASVQAFMADPSLAEAMTKGGVIGGGVIGAGILSDPVGLTSTLVSVKGNAVQLMPAGINLSSILVPILILAAFGAAAWFLGRKDV